MADVRPLILSNSIEYKNRRSRRRGPRSTDVLLRRLPWKNKRKGCDDDDDDNERNQPHPSHLVVEVRANPNQIRHLLLILSIFRIWI